MTTEQQISDIEAQINSGVDPIAQMQLEQQIRDLQALQQANQPPPPPPPPPPPSNQLPPEVQRQIDDINNQIESGVDPIAQMQLEQQRDSLINQNTQVPPPEDDSEQNDNKPYAVGTLVSGVNFDQPIPEVGTKDERDYMWNGRQWIYVGDYEYPKPMGENIGLDPLAQMAYDQQASDVAAYKLRGDTRTINGLPNTELTSNETESTNPSLVVIQMANNGATVSDILKYASEYPEVYNDERASMILKEALRQVDVFDNELVGAEKFAAGLLLGIYRVGDLPIYKDGKLDGIIPKDMAMNIPDKYIQILKKDGFDAMSKQMSDDNNKARQEYADWWQTVNTLKARGYGSEDTGFDLVSAIANGDITREQAIKTFGESYIEAQYTARDNYDKALKDANVKRAGAAVTLKPYEIIELTPEQQQQIDDINIQLENKELDYNSRVALEDARDNIIRSATRYDLFRAVVDGIHPQVLKDLGFNDATVADIVNEVNWFGLSQGAGTLYSLSTRGKEEATQLEVALQEQARLKYEQDLANYQAQMQAQFDSEIMLADGGRADKEWFESLPDYIQSIGVNQGLQAVQDVLSNHFTTLKNGEIVPNNWFNSLSPELQDIGKEFGYVAMNEQMRKDFEEQLSYMSPELKGAYYQNGGWNKDGIKAYTQAVFDQDLRRQQAQWMIVGKDMGTGNYIARDKDGKPILDENGNYQIILQNYIKDEQGLEPLRVLYGAKADEIINQAQNQIAVQKSLAQELLPYAMNKDDVAMYGDKLDLSDLKLSEISLGLYLANNNMSKEAQDKLESLGYDIKKGGKTILPDWFIGALTPDQIRYSDATPEQKALFDKANPKGITTDVLTKGLIFGLQPNDPRLQRAVKENTSIIDLAQKINDTKLAGILSSTKSINDYVNELNDSLSNKNLTNSRRNELANAFKVNDIKTDYKEGFAIGQRITDEDYAILLKDWNNLTDEQKQSIAKTYYKDPVTKDNVEGKIAAYTDSVFNIGNSLANNSISWTDKTALLNAMEAAGVDTANINKTSTAFDISADDIKSYWDGLSNQQKLSVAQIYDSDPNRSGVFAGLAETLNMVQAQSAKSIPLSLLTFMPIALTTPIAKAGTGQRITPEDWATFGAVGAMLLAPSIGGMIGKLAGRLTTLGIDTAATGVFIAPSIPIILDPKTPAMERLMTIGFDVAMLAGLGAGIKGLKGGKAIEGVEGLDVKGEIPEVKVSEIATKLNNEINNIVSVRPNYYTAVDIKQMGVAVGEWAKGLPKDIRDGWDATITNINNKIDVINDIEYKILSGELKDEALATAQLALAKGQVALEDAFKAGIEFAKKIPQESRLALSQAIIKADELTQSVKNAYARGVITVINSPIWDVLSRDIGNDAKIGIQTAYDGVKDSIPKGVDAFNASLIRFNNELQEILSHDLTPDTKAALGKIKDSVAEINNSVQNAYIKANIEVLNSSVWDVLSRDIGADAKNALSSAYNELKSSVNQGIDYFNTASIKFNNELQGILSHDLTPDAKAALNAVVEEANKINNVVNSAYYKTLTNILESPVWDVLSKDIGNDAKNLLKNSYGNLKDSAVRGADSFNTALIKFNNDLQEILSRNLSADAKVALEKIKDGVKEIQTAYDKSVISVINSPVWDVLSTDIGNEIKTSFKNRAEYYKLSLENLKNDINYEFKRAEIEKPIIDKLQDIKDKLEKGEITETEAQQRLLNFKDSKMYQDAMALRQVNLQSQAVDYLSLKTKLGNASRYITTLEGNIEDAIKGKLVSGWNADSLKGLGIALKYGDQSAFDASMLALRDKVNKLPSDIRQSITLELDKIQNEGNGYIKSLNYYLQDIYSKTGDAVTKNAINKLLESLKTGDIDKVSQSALDLRNLATANKVDELIKFADDIERNPKDYINYTEQIKDAIKYDTNEMALVKIILNKQAEELYPRKYASVQKVDTRAYDTQISKAMQSSEEILKQKPEITLKDTITIVSPEHLTFNDAVAGDIRKSLDADPNYAKWAEDYNKLIANKKAEYQAKVDSGEINTILKKEQRVANEGISLNDYLKNNYPDDFSREFWKYQLGKLEIPIEFKIKMDEVINKWKTYNDNLIKENPFITKLGGIEPISFDRYLLDNPIDLQSFKLSYDVKLTPSEYAIYKNHLNTDSALTPLEVQGIVGRIDLNTRYRGLNNTVERFGLEDTKVVYPELTQDILKAEKIKDILKEEYEGKPTRIALQNNLTNQAYKELIEQTYGSIDNFNRNPFAQLIQDLPITDKQLETLLNNNKTDWDLANKIANNLDRIEQSEGGALKYIPKDLNDVNFNKPLYSKDIALAMRVTAKHPEIPIIKSENPLISVAKTLDGNVHNGLYLELAREPEYLGKSPQAGGIRMAGSQEFIDSLKNQYGDVFISEYDKALSSEAMKSLVDKYYQGSLQSPIIKLEGEDTLQQAKNIVKQIQDYLNKHSMEDTIKEFGLNLVSAIYPFAVDYALNGYGYGGQQGGFTGKPTTTPKPTAPTETETVTIDEKTGTYKVTKTPIMSGTGSVPHELMKPLSTTEAVTEVHGTPSPIITPITIPSPIVTPTPIITPTPLTTPAPITTPSPIIEPILQPVPEPIVEPMPTPISEPIITPVPTPTPTPIIQPTPEPIPEPVPQPVPEPLPQPLPVPVSVSVSEPIPPIPPEDTKLKPKLTIPTLSDSEIPKELKGAKGIIQWRQGVKWEAVPPPYDKIYHLDKPLPGTKKFAVGKGSAKKTLDVLNGKPPEDVDLDLGWTNVHIDAKKGTITYGGGKEAANERWKEERKLDELEKSSYDDIPEGEITQKIPKGLKQDDAVAFGLKKIELPQYRVGKIRVYLVSGDYVRSVLSKEYPDAVDFTQGNNFMVGEYVPDNEIWVDKANSLLDRKATLLHELREVRKMQEGTEYSEAHSEYANPLEVKARHNPDSMDDMIRDEISESPYYNRVARKRVAPEPKYEEEETVIVPSYVRRRTKPAMTQVNNSERIADRLYLGRKVSSPPAI